MRGFVSVVKNFSQNLTNQWSISNKTKNVLKSKTQLKLHFIIQNCQENVKKCTILNFFTFRTPGRKKFNCIRVEQQRYKQNSNIFPHVPPSNIIAFTDMFKQYFPPSFTVSCLVLNLCANTKWQQLHKFNLMRNFHQRKQQDGPWSWSQGGAQFSFGGLNSLTILLRPPAGHAGSLQISRADCFCSWRRQRRKSTWGLFCTGAGRRQSTGKAKLNKWACPRLNTLYFLEPTFGTTCR